MTKETETDLRLLGLRGLLESDRFYKRPDSKKLPTYFQMGTVIEGAAEFYSGALAGRGAGSPMLAPPVFRQAPAQQQPALCITTEDCQVGITDQGFCSGGSVRAAPGLAWTAHVQRLHLHPQIQ